MGGIKLPLCVAAALSAVAASPVAAQTLSTSAAQFNAGYGRVAGQENQPVADFSSLGAMNAVMTTTIQSGPTTLILSGAGASATAGLGGSVTILGSGFTVITQSRATTTVTNLGAAASASASASASTELNGTIDLDGPH